MKKYKVGYTAGVYDMFHVGHLNLLRRAKEHCEHLIVAVTTDEAASYKKVKPVIPFEERAEIIGAIRYTDKVVAQENMDKIAAWKKHRFDVMFVGDDWQNTSKWAKLEEEFAALGVDIVYFPYTKEVSSTILREKIKTQTPVEG
ncbi:MAG: adenylyltransferase/cytidyltransferase family protein [Oscillospiraceae bacterium]|nr:adenylyltransferase/cytidyltransferase family protein [Oscillospiraceae bacterium]